MQRTNRGRGKEEKAKEGGRKGNRRREAEMKTKIRKNRILFEENDFYCVLKNGYECQW